MAGSRPTAIVRRPRLHRLLVILCGACGARSGLDVDLGGGGTEVSRDVEQVSIGELHACALAKDGTVSCWGDNALAQLGDGTRISRAVPTRAEVVGIVQVALGKTVSHGLTTGGDVVQWGANLAAPRMVDGLGLAVQIAAAANDACALSADGTVRCWRVPMGGVAPPSSPVLVGGLSGVVRLALGGTLGKRHACALLGDGDVACWDSDGTGELVNGPITPVPNLEGATDITVGGSNACARLIDGTARCWGRNTHGQLGNGTLVGEDSPIPVPDLVAVEQIALGGVAGSAALADETHVHAVLADGTMHSWGANASGALGDGTTTDRWRPTRIERLGPVSRVSVGVANACAILRDGALVCWGSNDNGTVGDATTDGSPCGGFGFDKPDNVCRLDPTPVAW
jgi:hypothetical protein